MALAILLGTTEKLHNFSYKGYLVRQRKSWMEEVQTAMTTRNLEPDQWRNREEWRLVSGRQRQLLKNTG